MKQQPYNKKPVVEYTAKVEVLASIVGIDDLDVVVTCLL